MGRDCIGRPGAYSTRRLQARVNLAGQTLCGQYKVGRHVRSASPSMGGSLHGPRRVFARRRFYVHLSILRRRVHGRASGKRNLVVVARVRAAYLDTSQLAAFLAIETAGVAGGAAGSLYGQVGQLLAHYGHVRGQNAHRGVKAALAN